jgi:hypothetical protein
VDGQAAGSRARFSFKLGLLLLAVFPTDIITSVTVGTRSRARASLGGTRCGSSR